MLDWNPSYNWTYEQFITATTDALEVKNQKSVCLDVEHSDYKNMESIILWAKQKGYWAEEVDSDTIMVYKTKPSKP